MEDEKEFEGSREGHSGQKELSVPKHGSIKEQIPLELFRWSQNVRHEGRWKETVKCKALYLMGPGVLQASGLKAYVSLMGLLFRTFPPLAPTAFPPPRDFNLTFQCIEELESGLL